ncbi:uncharacterized protein LOC141632292 [Silene latifolia]|uniref:uncharacterized protein LOC141632292 n=1 Tax=Silene latifolia TaxID=37657 RepID=UPI003D771617
MLYRYFDSKTTKDIIAMEPPKTDIDDFIYWKFTEDGVYTAKSGYFLLWSQTPAASSACSRLHQFPWHIVWKKTLPRKLSILLWKVAHNILPTNVNLLSRGLNVAQECHLCHSSHESMDHLFRSCSIAQHLWKSSWLGINAMANPFIPFLTWIADFLIYLARQSFGLHKDFGLIYFCCTLRAIWNSRNLVLFQNHPVRPAAIYHLIGNLVSSTSQLRLIRSSVEPHAVCLPPIKLAGICKPRSDHVVYISLAIQQDATIQCFTDTIWDSALDDSVSNTIRARSGFVAAARLLIWAMQYAQQKNYSHVSFCISCRKLSTVLANKLPHPILTALCLSDPYFVCTTPSMVCKPSNRLTFL